MISIELLFNAFRAVRRRLYRDVAVLAELTLFDRDVDNRIYKLWNRVSSGTYFPDNQFFAQEDRVSKDMGAFVDDCVVQMAVLLALEPVVESLFLNHNFACRRNKGALDAVSAASGRAKLLSWALVMNLYPAILAADPQLLIERIDMFLLPDWEKVCVRRWLEPGLGRPRSGKSGISIIYNRPIVGPMLLNVLLHSVLDTWIISNWPKVPVERYDGEFICHFASKRSVDVFADSVRERLFRQLDMIDELPHTAVFCDIDDSIASGAATRFDFLGYEFRQRRSVDEHGRFRMSFRPAIGDTARVEIATTIHGWNRRSWVQMDIEGIAASINPIVERWIKYYGRFGSSELRSVLRAINRKLLRWVRDKFKRFRRRKSRAASWIRGVSLAKPLLFCHWSWGVVPYPGAKVQSYRTG